MSERSRPILLEVTLLGAPSAVPAEMAARLRDHVRRVPGVVAHLAEADIAEPGSKSGLTILETIVAISAAGATIPTLLTVIKDWLTRQPPATAIKIKDGEWEFTWSGSTLTTELEEAVRHFIATRNASI